MNSNQIKQCGDPDYSQITFTWDLNTNCQYRCDYCYAYEMLTKKFIEKYRYIYKDVIKRLSLKSIGKFKVELVGGEPMLHPDIYDVVSQLKKIKNCICISMNTNLVKDVKYYQMFDEEKYKDLEFSASFHPQYNKKIDKFFKKIKIINTFKYTQLVVNMNVINNDKYIPLYQKLILFCKKNNIDICPNFIFSTNKFKSNFDNNFLAELDISDICNDTVKYEFEDGLIHDYKLSDLYEKKLINFKGFNCRPKMWNITVDGNIINKCTHEPLHLLNKNINKCVKCPLNSCECEELYFYHKTAPGMLEPLK